MVSNDPGTGAYASMHSWDALLKGPTEVRRHDIHFVVLAGTLVVAVGGRPPHEMARGSYAMVPAGTEYTITSGNQGETLFYVHQPGPPETVPRSETK